MTVIEAYNKGLPLAGTSSGLRVARAFLATKRLRDRLLARRLQKKYASLGFSTEGRSNNA